ncbi:hypothetical protein ACWGIP_25280, partial [Streptomyces sp. NPDC054838]
WHPGRCTGIRRSPEGADFVSVRADDSVLRLELGGDAAFRRIAVSVPDAEETARTLRSLICAAPPPDGAQEGDEANGGRPEQPPHRPLLQHEGGTVDDHGRAPGAPSRTGTGAQPKADDERVRRANERDGGS